MFPVHRLRPYDVRGCNSVSYKGYRRRTQSTSGKCGNVRDARRDAGSAGARAFRADHDDNTVLARFVLFL